MAVAAAATAALDPGPLQWYFPCIFKGSTKACQDFRANEKCWCHGRNTTHAQFSRSDETGHSQDGMAIGVCALGQNQRKANPVFLKPGHHSSYHNFFCTQS